MGHRTPLYDRHRRAGARFVDFAGWDMPIQYTSQLEEHRAVRTRAGMFDVSHMAVVDLDGVRVRPFLRHVLANDVARLSGPGRALYTCLLNAEGGVLDDLIVYAVTDDSYRTVVNAATRDKDLAWLRREAEPFGVAVRYRDDLAMLAVQGPGARELARGCLPPGLAAGAAELKPFSAVADGDWFVSRTGYTGEDGFEVMLPGSEAPAFWDALSTAGVRPCGLGARDTLRLEAGLNLYGQDMDESVSPLESGLGWTVAWEPVEREFIGRAALERQRAAGGLRRLVGLVLEGRGVMRAHQIVRDGELEGEVTSGSFSPTLGCSIALARVPTGFGATCRVAIRGRELDARVVRPPFVRHGRPRV